MDMRCAVLCCAVLAAVLSCAVLCCAVLCCAAIVFLVNVTPAGRSAGVVTGIAAMEQLVLLDVRDVQVVPPGCGRSAPHSASLRGNDRIHPRGKREVTLTF